MARRRVHPDVDDIIPKAGFIRDYLEYACRCTDAPPIYHVGCAATAVSVAVADTIDLVWEPRHGKGSAIPLNLWTMIVGRSSLDRKSTSVNLVTDLINDAIPHKVAPISGSVEGLVEFLADQPCAIFIAPELAALLDQMEASYWKQGRTLLMDLYDGRSSYMRKLRGHEPVVIRDPRVCMLAASALTLLDQTTRATDWSGGFLARVLPIYAERNTWRPARGSNDRKREDLSDALADIACLSRTTVKTTEQARRMHARFSKQMDELAQRSPAHMHGPICRLADHVQRVAAIYALTTDSDLGYSHMQQAIAFGRLCLGSIKAITDKVARDPMMRLRNRVLDLLMQNPEGIWKRDLLRRAPALVKQLDPVLATLQEEERVGIEIIGRKALVVLYDGTGDYADAATDDDDDDEGPTSPPTLTVVAR